ncbi:MAG: hypothetical protein JWQ81_844 [Amycolatopsis sp.]|nr:hypothetical protein [Amycolatopsis sp.]
MARKNPLVFIGFASITLMLAACSGKTVPGNPTAGTEPTTANSSSATPSAGGAPPVQVPLPAKAIDGSPCDTALTSADLTKLIGPPSQPKPSDTPLGPSCAWDNASDNGAGITVFYQTKSDQGLNLAYKNVKPTATHWAELPAIQGYPAVAYRPAGDPDTTGTDHCQVVVGISNTLAYSAGITLSDTAKSKGIDPCTAGRDVADHILTNIKARG